MKTFAIGCLVFMVTAGSALAVDMQQVVAVTDSFYTDLAAIIEQNMGASDECLRQAQDYYQTHADQIAIIRAASEEAMQKIKPQLEAYMHMTEAEAEAMQSQAATTPAKTSSQMSASGARYTEALKKFTQAYPAHGMKIAGMAMQLFFTPGAMPFDQATQDNEEN